MEASMVNKIQHYFSTQPIDKAWLFGSYSRGEETPESDIDILVRYDEDADISLATISGIMVNLGKILQRRVDIVEEGCLLPFARNSVDNDKILIYERKN